MVAGREKDLFPLQIEGAVMWLKWLLKYDRPLAIHPYCTINARYGKCNHANLSSIRPFHGGINADGVQEKER